MMFFYQVRPPVLSVGDIAPNISFRRSDGTALSVSDLRGKILVLEFTALNCAPCREVAPRLEKLAAEQSDVIFLTISTGRPEELARLAALRGAGARTELVQDPYNPNREMMGVWRYGNPGVPAFYIVDKKGRLASRLIMSDDLSHVLERIKWARKR